MKDTSDYVERQARNEFKQNVSISLLVFVVMSLISFFMKSIYFFQGAIIGTIIVIGFNYISYKYG